MAEALGHPRALVPPGYRLVGRGGHARCPVVLDLSATTVDVMELPQKVGDRLRPWAGWEQRRRVRKAVRELRDLPRQWALGVAGSALCTSMMRLGIYRSLGLGLSWDASVQPGLRVRGRLLTVGRASTLNRDCLIDCTAPVVIGSRCGIGFGVRLITASHDARDPEGRAGAEEYRPITIGNGVWIGSGATVLAGVHVGDGAVIAAGAVVTKDCLAHTLYAGVPARALRELPR